MKLSPNCPPPSWCGSFWTGNFPQLGRRGRVRLGKAVCSFPNFPALPISHTARL